MLSGFVKYRREAMIALTIAAFAAAWGWLPQVNGAAAQQGPAASRGVRRFGKRCIFKKM